MLTRLTLVLALVLGGCTAGADDIGPSDVFDDPTFGTVALGMRAEEVESTFPDRLRPLGYIGYALKSPSGTEYELVFDPAGASEQMAPPDGGRLAGIRRVISGVDDRRWEGEVARLVDLLGPPSACLDGPGHLQHQVIWDLDPGVSMLIPARGAPDTAGLVFGADPETPSGFQQVPC